MTSKNKSNNNSIESGDTNKKMQCFIDELCTNRKVYAIFIFIAGLILTISPYTGSKGLSETYDFDSFKSAYCEQGAEKKISDRSDVSGIFTYGPYISLTKGEHNGVISYSSDVDIRYEVTSEFGRKQLMNGILKAGGSEEAFTVICDEAIANDSVELRTYYDGKGSFEFKSLSLSDEVSGAGIFLLLAAMLLIFGLIVFITKKVSYGAAIYCAVFFMLMRGFIMSSTAAAIAVFVIQALWLITMLGVKKFKSRMLSTTPEEAVVMLISAFLITSCVFLLKYKGGVSSINLVGSIVKSNYIALLVSILHIILLLRICEEKPIFVYGLLLISSVVFAFTVVHDYRNINLSIGIIAILGYINYYLLKDDKLGMQRLVMSFKSYKAAFIIVAAVAFSLALFYTYQTIMRYRIYGASCFDFGVFAQMYEYMATTGMPLTTCERGYLLSHFYIHFSPIYYLFLPIYFVVRRPETLLTIQAFMVFAAAIPLFLICKRRGVKPLIALIVCCIYMFSPAIGQPLFYDFHENKFIPFFVMWFIYCFESKKYKLSYLMLVLCLMIKEDTSIYMMIIAMYFIICDKNYKHGGIALSISAIYFGAVMFFIQKYGHGLMEGHYSVYYMTGQKGFVPLAANIALNPGFFLKNVFAADNFEYIYYTIGSLLFIPMINKNLKRLVLLVPFVAFGLMTTYSYQHNIGYQYTYGLMIIMFYLFVVNLSDLSVHWINVAGITCLCAGIILSYTYKGDGFISNQRMYKANQTVYTEMDKLIAQVPDDVSITAETYLLPHLYDKKELYMLDTDFKDTDYYVLQKNPDSEAYVKFTSTYAKNLYELVKTSGKVEIYKKRTAPGLNLN